MPGSRPEGTDWTKPPARSCPAPKAGRAPPARPSRRLPPCQRHCGSAGASRGRRGAASRLGAREGPGGRADPHTHGHATGGTGRAGWAQRGAARGRWARAGGAARRGAWARRGPWGSGRSRRGARGAGTAAGRGPPWRPPPSPRGARDAAADVAPRAVGLHRRLTKTPPEPPPAPGPQPPREPEPELEREPGGKRRRPKAADPGMEQRAAAGPEGAPGARAQLAVVCLGEWAAQPRAAPGPDPPAPPRVCGPGFRSRHRESSGLLWS